jgi:hypothetical protein
MVGSQRKEAVAMACWWPRYNLPGSWLLRAALGQNGRSQARGARPWDLNLSSDASHGGNSILIQLRQSEICHPLHRSSLL